MNYKSYLEKKLFLKNLILLAFSSAAAIVIIGIVCLTYNPYPKLFEIQAKIYTKTSATQLTGIELATIDSTWKTYNGKRVSADYDYAYAAIIVDNKSNYPLHAYILNKSYNQYTAFLKLNGDIAETTAIFGDQFPIFKTTSKHPKAVFPITIPAKSENNMFIMEYTNAFDSGIDPAVLSENELGSYFEKEHFFMYSIFLFLAIGIILNLADSLLNSNLFSTITAFFFSSETFFYLRQTRYLLVFTGQPYATWLYPLQMSCNLIFSILLISTLIKEKSAISKKIMYILLSCQIIPITLAFCGLSLLASILLNVNSLGVVVYSIVIFFPLIKKGNKQVLYVFFSMIPWMLFMSIDVVCTLLHTRSAFLTDYSPTLALASSMFLLLAFKNYFYPMQIQEPRNPKSLYSQEMHDFLQNIMNPLNIIQSSAKMIQSAIPQTRIFAAGNLIEENINNIRQIIEDKVKDTEQILIPNEKAPATKDKISDEITKTFFNARIGLFQTYDTELSDICLLLQSEGFLCKIINSLDEVLNLIQNNSIDLLIISSAENNRTIYTLCKSIRAKFSISEFPIIGIADYYETSSIRKGYSAGINDFITKPFDASMLTYRLYAQLRLCLFFRENNRLLQSEHEKGTFLYFITHNINTPLTLLLNQLNELSKSTTDKELSLAITDLQLSANEINDIIQNALITFRLQDGRAINYKKDLQINTVFAEIKQTAELKAHGKMQTINWNIEQNIPSFSFDELAFKGIIVNILDNAIKFSPRKSIITVDVKQTEQSQISTASTEEKHIKHYIEISIIDSGSGIPKEKLPQLFKRFEMKNEPFQQGKSNGLGLYVAHELAALNNSSISYTETNSGSACFTLSIPL